ncbi:hypothetical protein FIBSPDRAFT_446354 [Athelia psychrophila]|uniref:Uncharacterized protein n=1 Tax=Athelia psychrophila TaxID=1759441 RepID=A0A166MAX7_9AGAM|nr:hypothetical protein FIBSPDRAFT_446354 [Fibularhizoctonia sp. CBS 109695]
MAGLVGGVHPAKLSVERHTRGSTPLNPIVVEDGVGRPLGRMHHPQPAPDPSKTVPPSNEEIIASLIREKNVYPVLESILKLIKGNKTSKSHDEPAAKRRRTNSGAEDAEQESTSNLEKERGKELIAQLVSLIKNAARQAAVRSYHQQPTQPRRAQPIQRWTSKPQAPEPKILGHYRPITATYGRPGAAVSEVLADQSNTTHSGSQTSLTTNLNMTSAPHIPSPLSIPPDQQPIPPFSPAPEPIAPAETSFDNFLSSFLAVPGLNDNSAGWSTDQSLSSSSLDIDQHTMNTWMSVFGSLSSEGSLSDATSQPPSEFDMDLMTSPPSDFSFHTGLTDFLPDHSMHDATIEAIPNPNPDFVIDPFLLNMPPPNPTTSLHPHNIGTLQSESSLGPNSAETSARGSLVPQSVAPEPAEDAAVQDPLAAADALMQFSSLAPSTSTTTHASSAHAPLAAPAIRQDIPRPTYQLFPQNVPTSAEQPLPSGPRTQQASQKAVTLRPMPTADKQSILTRAKERRRQLVGEIDRAKVELWETTIEQGVLAQLVKEKL